MYGITSYAGTSYAGLISSSTPPPPPVVVADTHDGMIKRKQRAKLKEMALKKSEEATLKAKQNRKAALKVAVNSLLEGADSSKIADVDKVIKEFKTTDIDYEQLVLNSYAAEKIMELYRQQKEAEEIIMRLSGL